MLCYYIILCKIYTMESLSPEQSACTARYTYMYSLCLRLTVQITFTLYLWFKHLKYLNRRYLIFSLNLSSFTFSENPFLRLRLKSSLRSLYVCSGGFANVPTCWYVHILRMLHLSLLTCMLRSKSPFSSVLWDFTEIMSDKCHIPHSTN